MTNDDSGETMKVRVQLTMEISEHDARLIRYHRDKVRGVKADIAEIREFIRVYGVTTGRRVLDELLKIYPDPTGRMTLLLQEPADESGPPDEVLRPTA